MPKYFFDIIEIDGSFRKDTIGVELPDAGAAREEAKRCLADMSWEAVSDELSEIRIVVRDEDGSFVDVRAAYFEHGHEV